MKQVERNSFWNKIMFENPKVEDVGIRNHEIDQYTKVKTNHKKQHKNQQKEKSPHHGNLSGRLSLHKGEGPHNYQRTLGEHPVQNKPHRNHRSDFSALRHHRHSRANGNPREGLKWQEIPV